MKKTIFSLLILAAAFGLSACTSQTVVNPETPAATVSSTAKSSNAVQINNQSSLGEAVAPTGSEESQSSLTANETSGETTSNNKTMTTSPVEQNDLVKQYSQAILKTSLGNITVKFYAAESPVTVNNFLKLAQSGFYNGTKFHRVIKDFMIQGGDPLSKESNTSVWGTGGPGYKFADEFNDHKLVAGSLAMANSGPDTNGSQFFIVTADATPWLDGHHTNFGEVVSGLDVVRKIEAVETVNPEIRDDRPVKDVVINSVELLK